MHCPYLSSCRRKYVLIQESRICARNIAFPTFACKFQAIPSTSAEGTVAASSRVRFSRTDAAATSTQIPLPFYLTVGPRLPLLVYIVHIRIREVDAIANLPLLRRERLAIRTDLISVQSHNHTEQDLLVEGSSHRTLRSNFTRASGTFYADSNPIRSRATGVACCSSACSLPSRDCSSCSSMDVPLFVSAVIQSVFNDSRSATSLSVITLTSFTFFEVVTTHYHVC